MPPFKKSEIRTKGIRYLEIYKTEIYRLRSQFLIEQSDRWTLWRLASTSSWIDKSIEIQGSFYIST